MANKPYIYWIVESYHYTSSDIVRQTTYTSLSAARDFAEAGSWSPMQDVTLWEARETRVKDGTLRRHLVEIPFVREAPKAAYQKGRVFQ